MCMLTHRLQILIDDERYERLSQQASERGASMATLVREAIDSRFPRFDGRKRAAIAELLAADPMPVPDDPADLKREILETRSKLG